MQSRIVIEKVNHSGEELECYVPQIFVGDWINILQKNSYILKDSFNPVVLCKKCDGEGCQDCNKRGFRKGVSVDLKYIAESLLNERIKEISKAKEILNKTLS